MSHLSHRQAAGVKWVNDSLKKHLVEQRENILAGDAPTEVLPALVGGVISEDALWACTTCGYCESACPIELEHSQVLPDAAATRDDGSAFPHELKAVFAAYEAQSNPWGFDAATRGDSARDSKSRS